MKFLSLSQMLVKILTYESESESPCKCMKIECSKVKVYMHVYENGMSESESTCKCMKIKRMKVKVHANV